MKNTKLIQLLQTFSPAEFNAFGKFLNSPIHNESAKMRSLYNFLKKYYPAFSHKMLTKENAYRKLYPQNPKYEDNKLRDRFSDMIKLAEEYLSFVYLKKNPVQFKEQMLHELAERGLDVHFDKKYKEISSILDKSKGKHVDYFQYMYNNEKNRSHFYSYIPLTGKRKPVYDALVKEVSHFLNYVSAQMISYYCIMYNWKDVLKYEFKYELYKPIMKFIEESDLFDYPLIKTNYLILKIMENEEDEKLYFELKDMFVKSIDLIDTEHKIRIGSLLVNDAGRRLMKGKKGFDKEHFEMMKFMLERGIYTDADGWLSREQYINYVTATLSFNQPEMAENFITNYTIKVLPDKRKHAHVYVRSLLHYHKKEHKQALKELSAIKGGDYIYFMRIKTLQSKIYFELGDYEKVLTIIDAFKHYISSNPLIPEVIKKRNTNYINFLYKLTLLKFKKNEFSTLKLIEEINNFSIDELTANKQWLLEMAMELKGN